MPNNRPVTPQDLLQGACYALEQCGILLDDATTLFEAESYATSVVLAAFAQEELGRSLILRELRKDVIAGKTVTVSRVKKRCEDHVTKQGYAGAEVLQNQVIGFVGSTGRATGPHLHYTLIHRREPVDPMRFHNPPVEPLPRELMPSFERARMAWGPLLEADRWVAGTTPSTSGGELGRRGI